MTHGKCPSEYLSARFPSFNEPTLPFVLKFRGHNETAYCMKNRRFALAIKKSKEYLGSFSNT